MNKKLKIVTIIATIWLAITAAIGIVSCVGSTDNTPIGNVINRGDDVPMYGCPNSKRVKKLQLRKMSKIFR